MVSIDETHPSPLLATIFRAPAWLYRAGMGWLLGKRFLALTHRGRTTGSIYRTVLEVISHDETTRESVVVSAYGPEADWYRNIQVAAALRVQTGRLDYVPEQRFLDVEERAEKARRFCHGHPWETRLILRVLKWIDAAVPEDRDALPEEVLSALPMVALRPAD